MNIKGILFDKDGTLIDFSDSWIPAILEAASFFTPDNKALMSAMLTASGYDSTTQKVLSGSTLAAGNNQQIADCWHTFLPALENIQILNKLDQIFQYYNEHHSTAVTDLSVLFATLKARNIKIGVATSDSEQGARKTLASLNVEQEMDFICGYDSGHGIKPEAGMVEAFCKRMNLSPQEVMVVGDNTHDLHMAHNAGAKLAIGVLTGTSSAVKLYEAHYILNSIADIPELLDKIL